MLYAIYSSTYASDKLGLPYVPVWPRRYRFWIWRPDSAFREGQLSEMKLQSFLLVFYKT